MKHRYTCRFESGVDTPWCPIIAESPGRAAEIFVAQFFQRGSTSAGGQFRICVRSSPKEIQYFAVTYTLRIHAQPLEADVVEVL